MANEITHQRFRVAGMRINNQKTVSLFRKKNLSLSRGRTSNWRTLLFRHLKTSQSSSANRLKSVAKYFAKSRRRQIRHVVERFFMNWTKARHSFGLRRSSRGTEFRNWRVKSEGSGSDSALDTIPSSSLKITASSMDTKLSFVPDPNKYTVGKVDIQDLSSVSGKFDDCCLVLEKSASFLDDSNGKIEDERDCSEVRDIDEIVVEDDDIVIDGKAGPLEQREGGQEKKRFAEEKIVADLQREVFQEQDRACREEFFLPPTEEDKCLQSSRAGDKIMPTKRKHIFFQVEDDVSAETAAISIGSSFSLYGSQAFEEDEVLQKQKTVSLAQKKYLLEQDAASLEQKKAPQEQKEAPEEQKKVPQEQKKTPQEQKKTPQEQKKTPQEQKKTPQKQEKVFQEQKKAPEEQKKGPQEQKKGPQEQKKGLQEQKKGPQEQRKAPLEQRKATLGLERALLELEKAPQEQKKALRVPTKVSCEGSRLLQEGQKVSQEKRKAPEEQKRNPQEQKMFTSHEQRVCLEKGKVPQDNEKRHDRTEKSVAQERNNIVVGKEPESGAGVARRDAKGGKSTEEHEKEEHINAEQTAEDRENVGGTKIDVEAPVTGKDAEKDAGNERNPVEEKIDAEEKEVKRKNPRKVEEKNHVGVKIRVEKIFNEEGKKIDTERPRKFTEDEKNGNGRKMIEEGNAGNDAEGTDTSKNEGLPDCFDLTFEVPPLIVKIMRKCTDRVDKTKTTEKISSRGNQVDILSERQGFCIDKRSHSDDLKFLERMQPNDETMSGIEKSFVSSPPSSSGVELMAVSFQEDEENSGSDRSSIIRDTPFFLPRSLLSPDISSSCRQCEKIVVSSDEGIVVTCRDKEDYEKVVPSAETHHFRFSAPMEENSNDESSGKKRHFRFPASTAVAPFQASEIYECLPDTSFKPTKKLGSGEKKARGNDRIESDVSAPVISGKAKTGFFEFPPVTSKCFPANTFTFSTPLAGVDCGISKTISSGTQTEVFPVKIDAETNTSSMKSTRKRRRVCHCRKFNLRARRLHRKVVGLKKLLLYRTFTYRADREDLISLLEHQSRVVENNSNVLRSLEAYLRENHSQPQRAATCENSSRTENLESEKVPENSRVKSPEKSKVEERSNSQSTKEFKQRAKRRLSLSQSYGTEKKSRGHVGWDIIRQKATDFAMNNSSSSILDSSLEPKSSQESTTNPADVSVGSVDGLLEGEPETGQRTEEELQHTEEELRNDEKTVEDLKKCLQDVEVDECLRDFEVDEQILSKKRRHIRFKDEDDVFPAVKDEGTAGGDEVMAGEDDVMAGEDDVMAGEDDVMAGEDDVTAGEDEATAGEDEVTAGRGSPEASASIESSSTLPVRRSQRLKDSQLEQHSDDKKTQFPERSSEPDKLAKSETSSSRNVYLDNDDILSFLLLDEQIVFKTRKINPNFEGISYDGTAVYAILSGLKANGDMNAAEDAILHRILGRSNSDAIREQLRQYLKVWSPAARFYFEVHLDTISGMERLRVVATKARKRGERIGLEGFKVPTTTPSGNLLQFVNSKAKKEERPVELLGPASFTSHSCAPNAKVVSVDRNTVELVTLSDILPGEEICIAEGYDACCSRPEGTSPEKKAKKKVRLFGSHLKPMELHDSVFKL